jgi:hypothetical protein
MLSTENLNSSDQTVAEVGEVSAWSPPRLASRRAVRRSGGRGVRRYVDPGNFATNIQAGARYG